ncbi:CBS domain-containing protein [Virgibacillus siamensis]|uniref:CBS domain-containing protein n=1 Tax=Virgibacillus siamensis TaxID=480071 RepID=UPI0009858745|nr:CBS domain-containing protein [Virgibacillus siamensis]
MKIKEFMIKDVISTTKDTTVKELLQLLVKNKVGGVPVTDDSNRLIGAISDGDIIRYLQPRGRTVYDMFSLVLVNEKEDLHHKVTTSIHDTAEQVMKQKKDLQMVQPNDEIEVVLNIFSNHHIKKVPVVDDDLVLVGVISRGDLIRYISTSIIANADDDA